MAINAGKVRAKIRQQEKVSDSQGTRDDYDPLPSALTENQLAALARSSQARKALEASPGGLSQIPDARKVEVNKAENIARYEAKKALRRAQKATEGLAKHEASMAAIQVKKAKRLRKLARQNPTSAE